MRKTKNENLSKESAAKSWQKKAKKEAVQRNNQAKKHKEKVAKFKAFRESLKPLFAQCDSVGIHEFQPLDPVAAERKRYVSTESKWAKDTAKRILEK
jgi:hypothetical protein